MGHKFSEFEIELYRRIDEIVHYKWDPFGVSSYPSARDEYYPYLPKILEHIKSGDTIGLEKFLTSLRVEHIGLNDNQESNRAAISIMMEWKQFLLTKYPAENAANIG